MYCVYLPGGYFTRILVVVGVVVVLGDVSCFVRTDVSAEQAERSNMLAEQAEPNETTAKVMERNHTVNIAHTASITKENFKF